MIGTLLFVMIAVTAMGCDSKQVGGSEVKLATSGIITCVNRDGGTTCFAGRYPELWDGVRLPDVPIVFHRPDSQARIVGPLMICLDNGKCFGDPSIGSIEAAEVVLQPPQFKTDKFSASTNVLCWLAENGRPECLGHNWGYLRMLSGANLRPLTGRYQDISLGHDSVCGTTSTGVNCEPLSIHADNAPELFLNFDGFEKPCQNELYICAKSKRNQGEVTCWFQEPPEIAMTRNDSIGYHPEIIRDGVVEYSCGSRACLNMGDRVECYSHENMSGIRFDVEIRDLSVGTFHFCGLTKHNEVLCRTFNEMHKEFFNAHRSHEFLSLESWRALLGKSKSKQH